MTLPALRSAGLMVVKGESAAAVAAVVHPGVGGCASSDGGEYAQEGDAPQGPRCSQWTWKWRGGRGGGRLRGAVAFARLAFSRHGIVPVVPPSIAVDKVRSISDAREHTYVCLTDAYVVSFTRGGQGP